MKIMHVILLSLVVMVDCPNVLLALPVAAACNSPHDCLTTNNTHNNLTCDYASSTCRRCLGGSELCDTARWSYSQCCPGYNCDQTGRCLKS